MGYVPSTRPGRDFSRRIDDIRISSPGRGDDQRYYTQSGVVTINGVEKRFKKTITYEKAQELGLIKKDVDNRRPTPPIRREQQQVRTVPQRFDTNQKRNVVQQKQPSVNQSRPGVKGVVSYQRGVQKVKSVLPRIDLLGKSSRITKPSKNVMNILGKKKKNHKMGWI